MRIAIVALLVVMGTAYGQNPKCPNPYADSKACAREIQFVRDQAKQVKPQPADTRSWLCDGPCLTYSPIAQPELTWKHELTKDGAYVQTFTDPSGKWRCVITGSSRKQFTMTCMDATLDEPTPAATKKEDANGK